MTTYATLATLTILALILILFWVWVDLAETRRQLEEERARARALRRALDAAGHARPLVLGRELLQRIRRVVIYDN